MSDQAWVTLATNDSYSLGAMVLGTSLRRVNTTRQLVVMVTPGVSAPMRTVLESQFNVVLEVNVLDSEDTANLALLTRPELGITFTKLHCWRLVQFNKCVFLDADTLVLQNCDELFEREEFSAAPDAGWPDCFNSGVFVFTPSLETYAKLLQFAIERGSFDGGDQGLLNLYFSDWSVSDIGRHLPFIYNMVASAVYSYLPAYRVFGQNVKIAHFIGPEKPWLQHYDTEIGQVRPPSGQEHLAELLQAWWDIFRADIHLRLSPEMSNESATVMEQVQSTLTSHIPGDEQRQEYIPSLDHPYYHPPPSDIIPPSPTQSTDNEPPNFPPAPIIPVNVLLVAIQRFPPEIIERQNPKPQPPPVQEVKSTTSHHPHPSYTIPPNPPPIISESESESIVSSELNQVSTIPLTSHTTTQTDDTNISSQNSNDESSKGLAGAYAKMSLEGTKSSEELEYVDVMRKHAWEYGSIDFLGQDSFDNILKKIQASMAQGAVELKSRAKSPTPPKTVQPETTTVSQPPIQETSPPTPQAEPELIQAVLISPTESAPVEQPISAPQITAETTESAQVIQPVVAGESLPVVSAQPSAPESLVVGSAPAVLESSVEALVSAVVATPTEASAPAPKVSACERAPDIVDTIVQQTAIPISEVAPAPTPETPAVVATPTETSASTPEVSACKKAPPIVATIVQQTAVPISEVAPAPTPEPPAVVATPTETSASTPEVSACKKAPPIVATIVQQTAVPIDVPVTKVAAAPAPESPITPAVPSKTAEELEDARLAQERQAVEKKLSEQKRIAEQKLQEEKAAAEASATAAAAAAAAAVAAAAAAAANIPSKPEAAAATKETSKPAGAAAPTASGIPQPKAPPRKQPSKVRTLQQKLGYGIGIGCLVLAIAIGTFYSTVFGSTVTNSFTSR